jgi:hypothetical protein
MVAAAVRAALDRMPLERALQLSIAALILLTVLSQGSLLSWLDAARKLRWAALLVFAALTLLYAARAFDRRRLGFVHAGAALLCALALASTAWSAFPSLTFQRAAAFSVLLAACAALGLGVAGRTVSTRRFVEAIVFGAALVVVGGLLVLLFRHDRAVQPATSVLAARYQGLGGGPNTAMMVLALATPLAAYALLETRRLLARTAALAVLLGVLGSIVASGSRGAILGSFGGLLAFAVLAPTTLRQRLLAGGIVLALLVVAVLITRIPQPEPGAPALPSAQEEPLERPAGTRPISPLEPPRLSDDVGHPPFGVAETTRKPRTLFGSSGRAQAWNGALKLGAERPVAGYGFGTEDRVFVDRYADFNSNTPENSYIGLFLQLGAVGLAAFVAFLAGIVVRGALGLSRLGDAERRLAAACAGAVVAGLLLAVFQSYVYAVGNNATASLWICVFLLVGLTPVARRLRKPA